MFISPSKIKRGKFLKGRTINFETPTKTKGNMVIIATTDKDTFEHTIASTLFRPMQLMALYCPRKIKPIGKGPIMISQKDYYGEIRQATNGRIKKGKTLIGAYNGQNIIYDFLNPYNINISNFKERRYVRQRLQLASFHYFEDFIGEATSDPDYSKAYLVFPMEKPFKNSQRIFVSCTDYETTDPLALFIQALKNGRLSKSIYDKIDLVIFYVPGSDIIMTMDLHDPELDKNLVPYLQKLKRLNGYLDGTDDITADIETEEQGIAELDQADKIENRKEDIKKVVLSKVAKTIKADNLTDFEAANQDEKDIMVSIDKKVDDYLAKPGNLKKTLNDMVDDIEKDADVKAKATRYVETKKANVIKADNLEKSLEKEVDTIGSFQDLDDDSQDNDADIFKVDEKHFDKRIETSHLSSLDEEYEKKQRMKDITNVVSSFSDSPIAPMAVTDFSLSDSSDYQNELEQLSVKYKTADGKNLSFTVDIPKIVDKRYMYLGGNKKVIKKQLIRLPIVKTKPDRVELTSNYNKMTIERTNGKLSRKNAYFLKRLQDFLKNPTYKIKLGDSRETNSKMEYENDFEYEELGGSIYSIDNGSILVYFNRDIMRDELDLLDIPDDFVKSGMTPLGFRKTGDDKTSIFYIEDGQIFEYNIKTKIAKPYKPSLFQFLIEDVIKMDMSTLPTIGKSFIYTTVKFLMAKYPVFVVVASQVGLTNTMDRYGVKYHFSKKREPKSINFVEVPFKDGFLYYEDTIRNTLLLNALYLPSLDTKDYNYSDFDAGMPYTHYFMQELGPSIGIHTREMLKINLGVFVDPITRDVLRDNNMPTDVIDMLLYANTLLVGNKYKRLNDMTNYRIRSNEIVADVLYGTLAKAVVSYEKHKMNGRPINLSIGKGAVRNEILKQPNVNDKSTLNPVAEAEDVSKMSAKGFHGVNINNAYTMEMRSYSESMNGIVSGNATPYSGSAGITRDISYDPKISTVRGYINYTDTGALNATNMLSPTELLSAFTAAGADAPRQAMQVAQTGHTMPTLTSSKQLIGSGMNKTLASFISNDFCFKAAKNGIVERIDDANKICLLQYDDGTKDAIDLASKLDKNSNMGFYIHQNFRLVYKEGERFEAGDVLAYNPSYFTGKGKNVDYLPGVLAKVAIAAGDFAFEDSTLISESLSKKAASKINMLRQIVLGKNAIIYKLVEIGDHVKSGDPLVEYTNSFDDPSTADFLRQLNSTLGDAAKTITHETYDSKLTGDITNVEIAYNCPFEQLDPSIQEIINKYQKRLKKRADDLKDVHTGNVHIPPITQVPPSSKKYIKKEFPEDGGVIISIWVEYVDVMGRGDKLTYTTALKGVVSQVLPNDEAPISDYRPEEPIEGILTPTGVISRMTTDIYSLLYGNKVLVELGKQIREIWDGKR